MVTLPMVRRRRHMAAFVLEGGLGPKLPTISASLAKQAARPKPPPPKVRVKLGKITPGSQIVTVNPDSGMGGRADVYVDEYNLAWHAVMNQMDITSGSNKYDTMHS